MLDARGVAWLRDSAQTEEPRLHAANHGVILQRNGSHWAGNASFRQQILLEVFLDCALHAMCPNLRRAVLLDGLTTKFVAAFAPILKRDTPFTLRAGFH
jgi:hypothetical protein